VGVWCLAGKSSKGLNLLGDCLQVVPDTHEFERWIELCFVLRSILKMSFVIAEIKLKSLILAQIERWRHALHMQVER
jgi:hypothetical protein